MDNKDSNEAGYSRKAVLRAGRERLVEWLREQLIGPPPKDEKGEEIIRVEPVLRYPTGVLYPVIQGESGLDGASIEDEDDQADPALGEDGGNREEVKATEIKRRYVPPSSAGFSFFIKGADIRIRTHCHGVQYIKIDRDEEGRFIEPRWIRQELDNSWDHEFKPPSTVRADRQDKLTLSDKAKIDVLWRPFADGWLVTVSLINTSEIAETAEYWVDRNELSIFEASMVCIIDSGDVGSYPRVDPSLLSEEELEIELQYRERNIYAVGHGVAVDWTVKDGRVTEIKSSFIPTVEVPLMTADLGDAGDSALSLAFLSRIDFKAVDDIQRLTNFVDEYELWVEEEKGRAADFTEEDRETAARITRRMAMTAARMKAGIAFLRENNFAARAFRVANLAMLKQMAQAYKCKGEEKSETSYRWRPFQLAFLLAVLESTAKDSSDLRDTVDLIWFPTGGGKTEAYLGLMAFIIAWRRYYFKSSGGGTTILMRYTLRLLTRQQFERATRMICALELIRRSDPDLGSEPITSGLWVGATPCPNRFQEAKQILDEAILREKPPPQNLIFGRCPWCEKPFDVKRNYIATEKRFQFLCHNPECEFGREKDDFLPCNIVDEALYQNPPTLLVSTIDKFARLAWAEEPSAFFGRKGVRPPELIVQDELHLVSGALGSIAGLYEAGLDAVIKERGVYPKYIASTATISMAREQCRALFGRDVSIFPPPGLSCDNSYFARTVPITEKSGRLYVGYLAPLLNRQECMAPLAAVLLAAPEICFDQDIDKASLQEAWWTQIVYHGSIKGVGNSLNAFYNDVREYYRQIFGREEEAKKASGESEDSWKISSERNVPRIKELTSRASADENADTFSRLEKIRSDPDHLDVVLATNMISVGLDVARLGLMVINGQPLTTAEYIQASSRVGRGEGPGIVVANYYRDQARSLSHYEDFRAYHEAFYRFVEPNSLTPYTYQARKRALHAALVIALRYSCPILLPNKGAAEFDPDDEKVQKVLELLKRRCKEADPGRHEEIENHIDERVRDWRNKVKLSNKRRRELKYRVNSNEGGANRLLISYEEADSLQDLEAWPTLNSMRNVEDSALIKKL